jgi:crotonobetainyl-CoA:carnitine CoA-transferase CaiB-like acyl-CoA transferase
MGGVNAGVAALAALRRARACGRGDHVDLSLLEAVTPTCTNVQSLYGSMSGTYDASRGSRSLRSNRPRTVTSGFCIFTGQQWTDFCVLIGTAGARRRSRSRQHRRAHREWLSA